MNNQCEIVQDILPLYVDQACSNASRQLVEEHISDCPDCSAILKKLKSDTYESSLREETEGVINHHVKSQKRKTLLVGSCIAGILCIPIIVCLIVNLAVGHALDWFFIVLTSLMVFASLTVVPLVFEKQRGIYTILSFTASLLLLLLTCSIYSHGDWFWVTASSVLFGLAVPLFPYIVYKAPLNHFLKNNKGLLILGVETLLFFIMMLCIGLYSASNAYWGTMLAITLPIVIWIWILFVVCRYLPANAFIRAGLASIIVGSFAFCADKLINGLLHFDLPWPAPHLGTWNTNTVDGNVKWLILIVCAALGITFIVIGMRRQLCMKKDRT